MTRGEELDLPGALVVSLDFELLWGVRDRPDAAQAYRPNLVGARTVIPRTLELFREFEIAATWATVGFLFAESRDELQRLSPSVRPEYSNPALGPYGAVVGEDESDDPLHFAPGLIRRIQATPRQEIATHTFSHYYCGEAGQDREVFREDLRSACAAADKFGISIRSIVFPRNQHNASYDDLLIEMGIRAYRGNPSSRRWNFSDSQASRAPMKRAGRLLDTYAGRDAGTVAWSDVLQPSGLSDVRASCFLPPVRPSLRWLENARLARLRGRVRSAARDRTLLHVWWHPHNFGVHQEANLAFLRAFLEEYARCRDAHGMQSLSMADVDHRVREAMR